MARTAAPAVKHLTESELAERWGLDPSAVARKRREGTGPKALVITESRVRPTIRYRLVDVEAWEAGHLRPAATA